MKRLVQMMLLLCSLGFAAMPTWATTITVNTTSNEILADGNCSLREAVQAANTNLAVDNCPAGQSTGTDDIFINLIGTITLSAGTELAVTEQVSIRGRSRGLSRLNGANQRKIFRINMTDMTDEFSLSDVRIENARGSSTSPARAGGAVQLEQGGLFSFTRVDFANNFAVFSAGGAISSGPLTGNTNARLIVEDCRFSENTAQAGGGAIASLGFNSDEALRSVRITGSEFRDNVSAQDVSGMSLLGVQDVTIESSQFADNESQDDDAAVRIIGGTVRSLAVIRETGFLNNTGVGLQLDTTDALLTNTLFYSNDQQAATTFGGGLQVLGNSSATVVYSTFIDNGDGAGSQIFVCANCEMGMRASIVWSAAGLADDCTIDDIGTSAGVYTSFGENIDATATCATTSDDLPMTDPLLLSLDVYGPQFLPYAVRSMPPRESSPAVDIGPEGNCPGVFGVFLDIDQRSLPKPTDGDDDGFAQCDSGSIEYQPGDDLDDLTLSVVFLGNGDGRIVSSPASIDCSSNCSADFLENTLVALTPTADAGNTFAGWSGACVGVGSCTIDMDQDQTVTASFVVTEFLLTVNVIGSGTVSSNPAGISCPGDCSEQYPGGSTVTLSASAPSGFEFVGWNGGGCSGTEACEVVMSQAQTVTAEFGAADVDLTVAVNGSGSVTSSPAGIDCPADCSESFASGETVTLTATPDPGFVFDGWSGDCSGTGSCQLSMTEGRNAVASFSESAPVEFTLTVAIDGTGTGSVASTPAGINCPADCSESFVSGEAVTLTATPDPGFVFDGWSGDCSGTGSCQLSMTEDRNAVASFSASAPVEFTLMVAIDGTGTGVVASTPAGINCPADCSESFASGETVTLTATPDPGFVFDGWSGDCSGTGSCQLNMTEDRNAVASFSASAPVEFTLMVAIDGTGTGVVASTPAGINCPADCSESLVSGEAVTLTATPDPGFVFDGWSGDCSGTGSCQLSMTEDRNAVASFSESAPVEFTLTVAIDGTGTGVVASTPAGINCPADCSESFASGETVTLTATPDPGFVFDGWTGDCSGTGSCQLSMTEDRNAVASFSESAPVEFTLTVAIDGTGTGVVASTPAGINCPADCSESFVSGEAVTLTATPDPGFVFDGWTGDCSGTGSCQLSMTEDRNAVASFSASAPVEFTLMVAIDGTGTGVVASTPAGINCPADCSESLVSGEAVTLTATPDPGFVFDGWSGDCSGTGSCQLSLTEDRNAVASFSESAPVEFTLTVAIDGTGTGVVASTPAGINCPADCSESFVSGETVTLTATPDPGFVFDGWSGDCSGTGSCQLSMTEDRNAVASFSASAPMEFTLTVAIDGTGTGVVTSSPAGIHCLGECSATFDQGQIVTLTATPDADQFFQNWAGDCTGGDTCSVTINQDTNVIAVFSDSPTLFANGFE